MCLMCPDSPAAHRAQTDGAIVSLSKIMSSWACWSWCPREVTPAWWPANSERFVTLALSQQKRLTVALWDSMLPKPGVSEAHASTSMEFEDECLQPVCSWASSLFLFPPDKVIIISIISTYPGSNEHSKNNAFGFAAWTYGSRCHNTRKTGVERKIKLFSCKLLSAISTRI